jgi:hypothetical protein
MYEFYWSGGILDIVGEMGNNGTIPNGIDMELESYNSVTNVETLVAGASIYFPKVPPPDTANFNPQTLVDENLAAGFYTIDTFASLTDSSAGDPGYQINFSEPASVPEPLTLSIFGAGLAGVTVLRRRKKTKQS